ncbi:DUF4158 domain-containing protein [Nocardia australiensis]|uniref:DUF4158 domain-containing protein n=1 Tax=Nocardia australiensis TaxID=2887191 RepID=UPI001D146367|nr:DUF4158 domain-containing protein [Nocardia australiensis]
MATSVFADEELARLREFPDISREELFGYCYLDDEDRRLIALRRRPDTLELLPADVSWWPQNFA